MTRLSLLPLLCTVLLCTVLLSACTLDPAPPSHAYLVRQDGGEPVAADPQGPLIQIIGIDVASHIQGMTVIRPDGQVDTLVYLRWASPVSEMVENWLRDSLLASGRFRGVIGTSMASGSSTEVAVSVQRFEIEELSLGEARARVSLEGWRRGGATDLGWVPLGRHEGSAPITAATGAAYANAMALALDTAVNSLAARLLEAHPPGG
jgi:ABC-type uncharacterized transport system auxiliary subunit